MLYVTTRNDRDAFTAQRTLITDRGPDGGFFVPFQFAGFSEAEVKEMLSQPFENTAIQVINKLLDLNLTPWDFAFYAGRNSVRLKFLGHRVLIGEAWHNPDWKFDRLLQNLMILAGSNEQEEPSEWFRVAVCSAVFAGICTQLRCAGYHEKVDFALVSGDFSAPISAWYLRSWGFPIGNIVCCCNENGNLWDLISNGQMRTDSISIPTDIQEADVVLPPGLERLIYGCGGTEETLRYIDACREGKTYIPPEAVLNKLTDGLYVSVVGSRRALEMIPRVYASYRYLLSPCDALCHCGLMDYRARFTETGAAVIFSEKSPVCGSAMVARSMGIPEDKLKEYN